MGQKEKQNMEYIIYGEKGPGCLGLLFHGIVSLFKFFFKPKELTMGDLHNLRRIHDRTDLNFPIKAERFKEKNKK